jgi:hypothetical protein
MARRVNIEQVPPAQTEQMAVTLSGSVEDACASAWLVVHSAGSDKFQVQAPLAVGKDGRWLTGVRLGEAEQGAGKTFEMVVFANAAAKLKEGDVLAAWPAAESRSAVMTVVRNAPAPEVAAQPVAEPTTPARPPADPPDCRLEIVNSLHEGRVTDRTEVRVEASAGCRVASVWVVVHPTAVETYWVQGRASARANVWRTNAYFGRPGRDWGARFEIRAFADPTRPLRVGQELPYWPEAAVSSNLIEVSKVQRNPAAIKKASSSGSLPTSVGYTGAVPNPRCIGCPYKH